MATSSEARLTASTIISFCSRFQRQQHLAETGRCGWHFRLDFGAGGSSQVLGVITECPVQETLTCRRRRTRWSGEYLAVAGPAVYESLDFETASRFVHGRSGGPERWPWHVDDPALKSLWPFSSMRAKTSLSRWRRQVH